MSTAERIAWELLSLIALIAWLRCVAPLRINESPGPQVPKESDRQSRKS